MDINQLYMLLTNNMEQVLIGTLILVLTCLVIFLSINIKLNRLLKRYNGLMKGLEGKNLEEIMLANKQMIESGNIRIEQLEQELNSLKIEFKRCISKVGVVRFNAFPDMGSDLSFSVALLDDKNNGFVLTGLTGRQDSRTYAKPVLAGKSNYHLTEEEHQALRQALS